MQILTLDITKENTLLVASNDTNRYVMGIGDTDYTIHREADGIRHMYTKDGGSFYRDFSFNDCHNYHVFHSKMSDILSEIKWRETIEVEGKQFNIKNAYIGIENKIKLIFHKADRFKSDRFTCEGVEIKELDEPVKYILEVEPIN